MHINDRIIIIIGLLFLPFGTLFSQTVPVTFQVNMSYQIELGNFDPESDFVDVAGTFNGWGTSLRILADSDEDSVYDITINDFTPGETIEYKFRYNGTWDGTEEFPGAGNNRVYTVQPEDNIIYVWYNDEVSPTGPPLAGFSANTTTLFENGIVFFDDRSAGSVEQRTWIFEAGSPDTSTAENPGVHYESTGVFDVTLIVGNDSEKDTLYIPDYIEVLPREITEIQWWNHSVFYELFVRSFYDSDGDGIGDFEGIIQKLDYLNDGDPETTDDLGVTGIWLMPIHDSPSYHGYDVTDYRSVNPDYGDMTDFQQFLDEAHGRGIRVIIDFVMNHSSTQHPWFQESVQNNPDYRSFYRWSDSNPGYSGPWGQQVWHQASSGYYYGLFWGGMPDLNYENSTLKDSMFAAADFWLNEIGVDGFRLDAVKYIFEEGSTLEDTESTFMFWNEFNQQVKESNPDAFAVGEAWTNTEKVLKYVENNRLDYCFEFDLASAILHAVNNENVEGLNAQMQKVYNLYPHLQYGTFLTNHDQNRVMDVFENDTDKAKVAAALYLTFPGIPYLYYGEEIGMVGSMPHEHIRRPMQWTAGSNAGFTSGQPWIGINSNYQTYNVATAEDNPASLLNWYKKLIRLRNETAALRSGMYETVITSHASVMAYLRYSEEKTVLLVINTGSAEIEHLSLTFLGSRVVAGNAWLNDLFGEKSPLAVSITDALQIKNLLIDPRETRVFELSEEPATGIPVSRQGAISYRLEQNYPNPFNPVTTIRYTVGGEGGLSPVETHHDASLPYIQLAIYNILGQKVTTLVSEQKQPGTYQVQWDAGGLASGLYFYRLEVDDRTYLMKKMLLVR